MAPLQLSERCFSSGAYFGEQFAAGFGDTFRRNFEITGEVWTSRFLAPRWAGWPGWADDPMGHTEGSPTIREVLVQGIDANHRSIHRCG